MGEYIVGVDLGGTQIRAALVDTQGVVHKRNSTLTRPEDGQDAVLERIAGCISDIIEARSTDDIRGIGIVAPGPLNPWTGIVYDAPNLGNWANVPLAHILEERFSLTTVVGNDANAAALAERVYGAGQGIQNLIYMTVSTGIGGGIISNGELLLGTHGFAGEIGHQTIVAEGPECNCGNRGCLEVLAAGPAIARHAVERLRAGESSIITEMVDGDLAQVTAATVSSAASQGDSLAIDVFQLAGYYIGVGIVNLIHIFDPELLIIGGGVSKAGDLLFDPIRHTVKARAIPIMRESVRIVPAALGDDVGLIGAACLLMQ